MTIRIDMTGGVTQKGCDDLVTLLTNKSIENLQRERDAAGRPPLSQDEIQNIFGQRYTRPVTTNPATGGWQS